MTFDLSDNSLSWQMLTAYLAPAAGEPPPGEPAEAPAAEEEAPGNDGGE